MDKEEFLEQAMLLLQGFIEEDVEIAKELLRTQGVTEHEIPSMLHTISNMALGHV